jgi:hypothetical protein
VKLGKEEQDRLVSQFKKEMLAPEKVKMRESGDGALVSYLKFNLWKRELLDAAREREEDAKLKSAFAAWRTLEIAVEIFMR